MSPIWSLVASGISEHIEKLMPTWWDAVGYGGQMLFFSRFFFQWLASERRGHSYIPVYFWWLSISGAIVTVVYLLGCEKPLIPILLGQVVGLVVYSRNLVLIRRHRRLTKAAALEPGDALYIRPNGEASGNPTDHAADEP